MATSASVFASRITLDHGGFTLLFDCELRLALRYEYRLASDTGSADRPSTYKQDPDVPAGCAQPTNTGTYHSVVSGWDRGHLVPSNHMDYNADYILRANYMTNVAPQLTRRLIERAASASTQADVAQLMAGIEVPLR